jgi:hypothetical protein
LDFVFGSSAVAGALPDFLKGRCRDRINRVASGEVRLDLIFAPRSFKLRNQVRGTDNVLAEAAQKFDRAGIDQGNCEDDKARESTSSCRIIPANRSTGVCCRAANQDGRLRFCGPTLPVRPAPVLGKTSAA